MNEVLDDFPPLEHHPYNLTCLQRDATILIVGTAPPPRFSMPRELFGGPRKGYDADFFYGSESNLLWHYLKVAANEPDFAEPGTPSALAENTEFIMRDYLFRHQIAMCDVLQTYRRTKSNPQGARDVDIDLFASGTTFLDFKSVFDSAKDIHRVVFTSIKAADWFFRKALPQGQYLNSTQKFTRLFLDAIAARESRVGSTRYSEEFCREEVYGRLVEFYIAPSPSPSNYERADQDSIGIYRSILFGKN